MVKNWIELLKAEVARTSATEVGQKIGYARTSVLLAANGKYKGSTDKIAAAVMQAFGGEAVHCPHLDQTLTPADCRDYHSRPIPQSSAPALKHWLACRNCEHRISRESEARHA